MLSDSDLTVIVHETMQEIGPARLWWTEAEEDYLREHIMDMTFEEIAAALGRSPEAVKIRQVRKQIPAKSRQPGLMTGQQAAKALGVDVHVISKLTQRGLFPAQMLPGKRRILSVSKLRLYCWAINPMHWIYFKVHQVTDLHLQRLVALAQARWEDEWLTAGQVEQRLGICPGGINQKLHRGQVRAYRWGNWWFLRSEIDNIVVRPSKNLPEGVRFYTPRGDAFLIDVHRRGLSYEAIGRLMKWPTIRVVIRLAGLGEIAKPRYLQH